MSFPLCIGEAPGKSVSKRSPHPQLITTQGVGTKMDVQALDTVKLAKTKPGVADKRAERMVARHHQNVVDLLTRFRMKLEERSAPESWTRMTTSWVLTLADVCDALGLDEQEKVDVLGQAGQIAFSEMLDTRAILPEGCPLNRRQMQALHHARQHGVITQGAYRHIYPHLSSETLRLDLADMVTRGLLHRHGNCRGTYYTVA